MTTSTDTFADLAATARHYEARLTWETDCADVHEALAKTSAGLVVLDVRSREAFDSGHVPGAISLPWREITAEALASFGTEARFVVYCWGPHCNGACKAAARLARLGAPVKEMLGGVWGWQQEGFALAEGA